MFEFFKKPTKWQPEQTLPEVNGIIYTDRDRAALSRHMERIQTQQAAKDDAAKVQDELREKNRKYLNSKI